jgi:hypothetical protein
VWHVPGTRHSVEGWFISFDYGKRLKDSHKHCHKQVQYQRVYPFTNSAYARVSLKRLTNSFCSPGRKATKVWSRWLIFALLLFLGTLLLWSHFLFLEILIFSGICMLKSIGLIPYYLFFLGILGFNTLLYKLKK